MKKILLLILLLLLSGGGYLGYEYFINGLLPQQVLNKLTGKDMPVEKEQEKVEVTYSYVKLPPLAVSIARGDRIIRIYTAMIMLEVASPAAEAMVNAALPKLQSAFLQYLYKVSSLPTFTDVADVGFVKIRLKEIADAQLGKGVVTAVLIQGTFDRKL